MEGGEGGKKGGRKWKSLLTAPKTSVKGSSDVPLANTIYTYVVGGGFAQGKAY